ncbi:guanylate cyclase, putative [Bodo saltans]|uniref:Guanylate cyclase, putative n=1 Tax=Bodo saltans TaxID=75058 RepID=A0A0S4IIY7_BODSA|nr:guanylate cyclase, putative [Bodo saltans]|eukprot:CUE73645.1 guanylate cyclase, putative [Bodo saltans]
MRAELIKMKSFLPQSVLRQLEEELMEEEEARAEGRRFSNSDSNEEDSGNNSSSSPTKPFGYIGGSSAPQNPNHEEDGSPMIELAGKSALAGGATADADGFPLDGFHDRPLSPQGMHEDVPSRTAANPLEAPSSIGVVAGGASDSSFAQNGKQTDVASDGAGMGGMSSDNATNSTLPSSMTLGNPIAATVDVGLTAVNPLRVLNTQPHDEDGRNSPGAESLAIGMSMRTDFVNLALTEKRKRRANRPTLQSLNDLCVLSAKRITVVMANCIGFHQILEMQGPQGLEQFHATLVDIVLKEVNATGGVLDFVHGDRFLITYNASTTCIPHGICAAEMVLRVRAKLNANPDLIGFQGIRFGLSAGEALCGNFGNDVMKRFSAVGPVVHQAFTLMQQTKAEEGHCSSLNLCCSSVFARIKNRAAAEHVNYVQLPGQVNAGLISTIRGLRRDIEPFDSLMGRTKIGFRKRAAAAAAAAAAQQAATAAGHPADGNLLSSVLEDDPTLPVEEILTIDKVNLAFETFANGDIEAAKEIAEDLPPHRTMALHKAFQVCE